MRSISPLKSLSRLAITSLLSPQMSMLRKSSLCAFSKQKSPRGFNLLAGSSIVSIFCIGMAHPAISTSRRLPYSSYFPSHTSSVFFVLNGCGLSGPYLFNFDISLSTLVNQYHIDLFLADQAEQPDFLLCSLNTYNFPLRYLSHQF